jgi:hypothetical protein
MGVDILITANTHEHKVCAAAGGWQRMAARTSHCKGQPSELHADSHQLTQGSSILSSVYVDNHLLSATLVGKWLSEAMHLLADRQV